MRIIFDGIVYSSSPNGGVYNYFNELIPRMAKFKDTEVRVWLPQVCSPPPNGDGIVVERNMLPTLSWIPEGSVRRHLGKMKRWAEGRLLASKVRGSGPAVFHSTQFTVSPWKDIPRVLTIYDMISELLERDLKLPHIVKMRREKRDGIENADRLIAISQTTKNDLVKVYGIAPDNIDVVHFGINHAFYSKEPSEAQKQAIRTKYNLDAPYILYVGGRLHHKNFRRFLEAYAKSAIRRDYLCAVAGFDWEPEEKKLITSLGVGSRLRQMPYLTSELPAVYQMASQFVFPSLYEGFGLPLIESMVAGCPVAAAKAGPFPELAEDAALFFNPLDIDDMIRAMEQLTDPATAEHYRLAGFRQAKKYSWDFAAKQTLSTYQKAIENYAQTGHHILLVGGIK